MPTLSAGNRRLAPLRVCSFIPTRTRVANSTIFYPYTISSMQPDQLSRIMLSQAPISSSQALMSSLQAPMSSRARPDHLWRAPVARAFIVVRRGRAMNCHALRAMTSAPVSYHPIGCINAILTILRGLCCCDNTDLTGQPEKETAGLAPLSPASPGSTRYRCKQTSG